MKIIAVITASCALLLTAGAAHADSHDGTAEAPLLLGVLEKPQCQYPKTDAQSVRVLFARTAEGWVPLHTAQAAEPYDYSDITWEVAFDGRDLGRLKTVDPGRDHIDYDMYGEPQADRDYKAFRYPADRLLDLAPGVAAPRIANKSKLFAGWCQEPPELRPIVLVTRPNFRDPAKWKPFIPGGEYRELLLKDVVAELREPGERVSPGRPFTPCYYQPKDRQNRQLAAEDIIPLKSYRDRAGRELISVDLAEHQLQCSVGRTSLWFLRDDNGIRFLGDLLTLVDAGDYDGDGSADVLFWYNGHNRDGYVLFHDNLGKRVNFYWSYDS